MKTEQQSGFAVDLAQQQEQKIREIEEKSEIKAMELTRTEIMPFDIRATLVWKQKTSEGPYVIHFDRTVSIDDLTGLPLGLKFNLKFETDYNTEPKINVKVVEGLELLRSVSINLGCASQNMRFDNFCIPSIGELRREDGFSNSTNSNTRKRAFWTMFFPRNVPRKIIDVTYSIRFDLGMKQIEIPKPEELKHGTLSVLRIFVHSIFLSKIVQLNFFVISQHSLLHLCHLTNYLFLTCSSLLICS